VRPSAAEAGAAGWAEAAAAAAHDREPTEGPMPTPPNPAVQDHYPKTCTLLRLRRLNEHGLRLQSRWEGDEVVARFTPRQVPHRDAGFVYGGLVLR